MVAKCWRTWRKTNCVSHSGNVVLSVSYYIIHWEQVIVRLRFRSFISSKKHHHCPVDIQPANEGCSPTLWGAGRTLPKLNHWLKATSLLILLSSHLLSESRRSFSGSTSHRSKARYTNPYLSSLLFVPVGMHRTPHSLTHFYPLTFPAHTWSRAGIFKFLVIFFWPANSTHPSLVLHSYSPSLLHSHNFECWNSVKGWK